MNRFRTALLLAIPLVLITGVELLMAQPPGMPGSPEQAPLGGLAILAGAGGLYAAKKLRDRHHQ